MNFLELAKKRYSVRNYNETKVEKQQLELILEAARIAPTGANLQPQHLLVIQHPDGLQKISKAANIYGAPCAIIVFCDKEKTWKRPFDGKKLTDIDAAIVTTHMMLQATDSGLGTLMVCYFKPQVIIEEFSLPKNLEPINILAIGYSDETPRSCDRHSYSRKPINETVSFESIKEFL